MLNAVNVRAVLCCLSRVEFFLIDGLETLVALANTDFTLKNPPSMRTGYRLASLTAET